MDIGSGIKKNIKDLIKQDYNKVKDLVKKASLEITSTWNLGGKNFFCCDQCNQRFLSKRDFENHLFIDDKTQINQIDPIN